MNVKNSLRNIAIECGNIILKYYGSNIFTLKNDSSPITEADHKSHNFLSKSLQDIKNVPVVSEENMINYDKRKNWNEFWLIDPLDGTKEFINEIDEFCVSIALIKNCKPTLGLIYAPALKEFYYAELDKGFIYNGPTHAFKINNTEAYVTLSRFHNSDLTKKFLSKNNLTHTILVGGAIKFGRLALGTVDLYPRFESSKEWDIAAGHLILKEAKGTIVDLSTGQEPIYNKHSLKNNFFIASKSSINIKTWKIPTQQEQSF